MLHAADNQNYMFHIYAKELELSFHEIVIGKMSNFHEIA